MLSELYDNYRKKINNEIIIDTNKLANNLILCGLSSNEINNTINEILKKKHIEKKTNWNDL